ncbi:MAG: DUF2283 domain-containing protein [Patescibacteria group bacterium]
MKISYDPRYNIAYIALREKREAVETLRLSDEVNIDISSDGKIYGIELLNANAQLPLAKRQHVVVTDESTGTVKKFSLTT